MSQSTGSQNSQHRYTGGCLCGAVRIEVNAAPLSVGICHCIDCRKRQGAVFHTFGNFPKEAVTVTGETRAYKTRHFCPTCGSPLFDIWPDVFELHAGCLDADNQLTPEYEGWVIRREHWLPPFEGVESYQRDRASEGRSEP